MQLQTKLAGYQLVCGPFNTSQLVITGRPSLAHRELIIVGGGTKQLLSVYTN